MHVLSPVRRLYHWKYKGLGLGLYRYLFEIEKTGLCCWEYYHDTFLDCGNVVTRSLLVWWL
jgi:hypothetical protein